MEMTGEYHIPAPRERVWQALNDPETLKRAIPGCREIEKVTDTEFTAKVVAKVGPVSATFGGKVNLTDLDPPKAYTISGEGTGGVAGFAKGSAKVRLDDEGADATRLHYEVQAHVGGKLAQIGSRLIDATSRKMADDFFSRFVEAMSPPAEAKRRSGEQGDGCASATANCPGTASCSTHRDHSRPVFPRSCRSRNHPRRQKSRRAACRRLVWVTGLTAVVAGILYYFTRKNESRLAFCERLDPKGGAHETPPRCGRTGTAIMREAREIAMQKTVSLTVNGKPVSATVEGRTLLVQLLREQLGLTGTHVGCDTSQCGACVVHVDGEAVKSCTLLALQAEGRSVLTIEGVATGDTLHPMQEAFRNNHALQCGFCTPGMVMSALDLVKNNPNPTEREIREYLEGNLCRCTGYHNIVLAIAEGAAVMRGETPPANVHGAAAE